LREKEDRQNRLREKVKYKNKWEEKGEGWLREKVKCEWLTRMIKRDGVVKCGIQHEDTFTLK